MRRIFGSKRQELTGGRRNSSNEEIHNLNAAPHIVRVIKLRSMRLAGHVQRMEEMENTFIILAENLEGKRPLEDLVTDMKRA
jgi:hypothetical protein